MAKFGKLIATGLGGIGAIGAGLLLYSADSNDKHGAERYRFQTLQAAQKVKEQLQMPKNLQQNSNNVLPLSYFGAKWDYNWDRREPSQLVEPSKGGEDDIRFKREVEEKKPKSARHLLLIRHGQYNLNGVTDKERTLTEKGIEQAKLTGKRLATLNFPYQQMIRSTMTRAQQTGDCILTTMNPGSLPIKNDTMLEEGAPCPPEPSSFVYKPKSYEFFQDGSRIEAAFRNYVYRADHKQKEDSYDLIVCHGNVIRYFVCRALQLPPEAWLRMQVNHASITWLCIWPNGLVSLKSLGDCGHLPPNLLT